MKKSHCADKMIFRPSRLQNRFPTMLTRHLYIEMDPGAHFGSRGPCWIQGFILDPWWIQGPILDSGAHVGSRGSFWIHGPMLDPGTHVGSRGPFWIQGPISKPTKKSYHKISWKLIYCLKICQVDCQISQRSENSKQNPQSFEDLRDLSIRHLIGYWDIPWRLFHYNCHQYKNSYCKDDLMTVISPQQDFLYTWHLNIELWLCIIASAKKEVTPLLIHQLTLANESAFWAGRVENWPGRVEFRIEHIRDICFRASASEI